MNVPDPQGLLEDVEFALALPLVGFVLAAINLRLTRSNKFKGLKFRLSLSFVLLLFLCLSSVLMFQDRSTLIMLWNASPAAWSALYGASVFITVSVIVGLAYWQLRPEKWRDADL